MNKFLVFFLGFLCLSPVFSAPVAARELGWQPAKTWVFAVGVLQFKHKDSFDSFPAKDRRDSTLVKFFKERGVPNEQIVFLKDKQATHSAIATSFRTFIQKPGPDDFVLIYFTGHGYEPDDKNEPYLSSYDAGDKGKPGWRIASIPESIARSRAGRALIFLDCCLSGTATEAAKKSRGETAIATLTSATAEEESTGNWTYTDALLDGLRGKPFVDLNRDGTVTLAELARHAENDMRLAEKQRSTFYAPPAFGPDFVLATAPKITKARIGERVSVRSEGDWYVSRIIGSRFGRFKVHYIGFDDDQDEWVTAKQIQPVKGPQYPVGAKVQVKDEGDWYPARIVRSKEGARYVDYDNYESDENEWVSLNRIRPAK
ncbi:MAG TPA: Tudor-knot domain-containing protein [Abditibacteriaceae bacterium]|jgi:hypothetical protein